VCVTLLRLLVISLEMTYKTGQMSVRASVRCQHFQNPTAARPLGRRRWNLARILYCLGTHVVGSRILNFGPCATRERGRVNDPPWSDYTCIYDVCDHINITRKWLQLHRHENFRIDEQWLWHYVITFARWQHLAVGRGSKCAVQLTPHDFFIF